MPFVSRSMPFPRQSLPLYPCRPEAFEALLVPLMVHPILQTVGAVRCVLLADEVGTVGRLDVVRVAGRPPAVDAFAVQGATAALQAIVPPTPRMTHLAVLKLCGGLLVVI